MPSRRISDSSQGLRAAVAYSQPCAGFCISILCLHVQGHLYRPWPCQGVQPALWIRSSTVAAVLAL